MRATTRRANYLFCLGDMWFLYTLRAAVCAAPKTPHIKQNIENLKNKLYFIPNQFWAEILFNINAINKQF